MTPCPNPRCQNGEVPGGPKGWLICPDCKGTARHPITLAEATARISRREPFTDDEVEAVRRLPSVVEVVSEASLADGGQHFIKVVRLSASPSQSYPDSTENPLGPPTVGGTEVTRPT